MKAYGVIAKTRSAVRLRNPPLARSRGARSFPKASLTGVLYQTRGGASSLASWGFLFARFLFPALVGLALGRFGAPKTDRGGAPVLAEDPSATAIGFASDSTM